MLNGVMVAGYEVREEPIMFLELPPVSEAADSGDEAAWLLGAEAWVPNLFGDIE